jgi:hypothetical protein
MSVPPFPPDCRAAGVLLHVTSLPSPVLLALSGVEAGDAVAAGETPALPGRAARSS